MWEILVFGSSCVGQKLYTLETLALSHTVLVHSLKVSVGVCDWVRDCVFNIAIPLTVPSQLF